MSLRFGSGWLVIYLSIFSCTFICSAAQLRARDYTTFNPSPHCTGGRPWLLSSLDREGAPRALVALGLQNSQRIEMRERRKATSSHSGRIVGKANRLRQQQFENLGWISPHLVDGQFSLVLVVPAEVMTCGAHLTVYPHVNSREAVDPLGCST